MRPIFLLVAALGATTAGCAGNSNIPVGQTSLPAATPGGAPIPAATLAEYTLGPLDIVNVTVFREPDLSANEAPVSLGGKLTLPLLGELPVVGRTTQQVADQIRDRLNARYLRDARVSVSVVRTANYTITIDGEVNKPGVYQIPSANLTLQRAIALGEGPAEFAKLDEVIVIREIDGRRYAARFDLRAIRSAEAPDPKLQQSDIVIVGYSRAASLFRTLIQVLPGAAGIFVALRQ